MSKREERKEREEREEREDEGVGKGERKGMKEERWRDKDSAFSSLFRGSLD